MWNQIYLYVKSTSMEKGNNSAAAIEEAVKELLELAACPGKLKIPRSSIGGNFAVKFQGSRQEALGLRTRQGLARNVRESSWRPLAKHHGHPGDEPTQLLWLFASVSELGINRQAIIEKFTSSARKLDDEQSAIQPMDWPMAARVVFLRLF